VQEEENWEASTELQCKGAAQKECIGNGGFDPVCFFYLAIFLIQKMKNKHDLGDFGRFLGIFSPILEIKRIILATSRPSHF
jgi:hypothetical protein